MYTVRVYLFDWALPRNYGKTPMHHFFWRQNVRQREIDYARKEAALWCNEHVTGGNATGFHVVVGENC